MCASERERERVLAGAASAGTVINEKYAFYERLFALAKKGTGNEIFFFRNQTVILQHMHVEHICVCAISLTERNVITGYRIAASCFNE